MNTKEIGTEAENFVCNYLKSKNYEIVERNWSCRFGEIDIIAKDGEELVFVEVRCRKDTSRIKPADTVSFGKQKRIQCAIEQYMSDNMLNMYARFDFAGVVYSYIDNMPVFQLENHMIRINLC